MEFSLTEEIASQIIFAMENQKQGKEWQQQR